MDKTVSELVLAHSVCGYVLDRYQIDYFEQGQQTLLAACGERRLDPAKILIACDAAIRDRRARVVDVSTHSAKHLLLTVVAQHHRYLHQTMPLLRQLTERVTRLSSERLPALHSVLQTVDALTTTLIGHLADEEHNVFPTCLSGNASQIRDTLTPVRGDHDRLLNLLEDLRRHCTDYVARRFAGNGLRTLYAELAYFDADTRRHLYFENDVLMPRFLAEASLALPVKPHGAGRING